MSILAFEIMALLIGNQLDKKMRKKTRGLDQGKIF